MQNLNRNGSVKRSRFASVVAQGDPQKIVALVPVGSKLVRERRYWFAHTPARPGVYSERIYIGSDEDKAILEQAWAPVLEEIERIEATSGLRQLLGRPVLARTSAEAAEERPRKLAAAGRGARRPKR